MATIKKSLDLCLAEVCKNLSITNANCKKKQAVFKEVFDQVKSKMLKECHYFKKYNSYNIAVGSANDGTQIKLDDFDMNIVIQLPISYEDGDEGIIIENEDLGFVQIKIKKAFNDLKDKTEWEKYYKVTSFWKDEDNYLLQSEFRAWLHSVVKRAVRRLPPSVEVDGVMYSLRCIQSDLGHTLQVQNRYGNIDFTLDVDLLPVIKFQLPRWPDGYRRVSNVNQAHWFVVAKPYNDIEDETLKNRLWRLSFQEIEKEMMANCQNLKMTIMLMKMLRDNLKMHYIVTYYIKTLFLWKIYKVNDKMYWNNKISKLFREMIEDLRDAIAKRNLPYFWKEELNLLLGIDEIILDGYETTLTGLINNMDANNIVTVFTFLLNPNEFKKFYENLNVSRPLSISHSFLDTLKVQQNKSPNQLVHPLVQEASYFPGYHEELSIIVSKLEIERSNNAMQYSESGAFSDRDKTKPSTSKETNSSDQNGYINYTRVKRKFHEI